MHCLSIRRENESNARGNRPLVGVVSSGHVEAEKWTLFLFILVVYIAVTL